MGYNLSEIIVEKEDEMELKLTIWSDEDMESPREYENLGTMIYAHRRYNLGDKEIDTDLYESWSEALRGEAGTDIIALPLYLYDHSGITMNTEGFHCRWDSGQVGWIYVSKEKVREEWKVKRISKKLKENILSILKSEVSSFDSYISGEACGFTLEDEGKDLFDSCGGFYGDSILENMKEHVSMEYHSLFDEAFQNI